MQVMSLLYEGSHDDLECCLYDCYQVIAWTYVIIFTFFYVCYIPYVF